MCHYNTLVTGYMMFYDEINVFIKTVVNAECLLQSAAGMCAGSVMTTGSGREVKHH